MNIFTRNRNHVTVQPKVGGEEWGHSEMSVRIVLARQAVLSATRLSPRATNRRANEIGTYCTSVLWNEMQLKPRGKPLIYCFGYSPLKVTQTLLWSLGSTSRRYDTSWIFIHLQASCTCRRKRDRWKGDQMACNEIEEDRRSSTSSGVDSAGICIRM